MHNLYGVLFVYCKGLISFQKLFSLAAPFVYTNSFITSYLEHQIRMSLWSLSHSIEFDRQPLALAQISPLAKVAALGGLQAWAV